MYNNIWLIFVLLVETVSDHGGQAGLELLTSSDLPTLASQYAGMPGVRHCAQQVILLHTDEKPKLYEMLLLCLLDSGIETMSHSSYGIGSGIRQPEFQSEVTCFLHDYSSNLSRQAHFPHLLG